MKKRLQTVLSRLLFAASLELVLAHGAMAQSPEHCTLQGELIELDSSELVYVLNDALIREQATPDANDDFFDDGVSGTGQAAGCGGGGLAGGIKCGVTTPIRNAGQSESDANGGQTATAVSKTNNAEAKIRDSARDLANTEARVIVPVKRYIRPGNPPQIFTVPSGRPRLESKRPISEKGLERLQSGLLDSLKTLGRTPYNLSKNDLGQLLNNGSGYAPQIPASGDDAILQTAPVTSGAKLPDECLAYFKMKNTIDRLGQEIRDKAKRCNLINANIKSTEKANAKDPFLAKVGRAFSSDNRIDRLKSNLAQCHKDVAALKKQQTAEKKLAEKRRKRLLEDQKSREVAAIKADKDLLAEEERIRGSRAIAARREYLKQIEKTRLGMEAYQENLKEFDDAIRAVENSDDPDKEQKLKVLKHERDRYEHAYGSWLDSMNTTTESRRKDLERAYRENTRDGIGPKNLKELRQRATERVARINTINDTVNPDAKVLTVNDLLSGNFGPDVERAALQAARDRKTLGGSTTTGQSTAELLGEVAADYYTMSPMERLRRMRKYGPDYLEGVIEGTGEGLVGLGKLVKGIGDVAAEGAGFEGFEGNSLDTLVSISEKGGNLFSQGTDGRSNDQNGFENLSSNLGKFWGKASDKFNRSFETAAGSGEKGTKQFVKTTGKGAALVGGGDVALLQGVAKLNQGLRAARGLDALGDAATAADKGGDLAKVVDAGADLTRTADLGADVTKTFEAAGDLTRTVDGGSDLAKGADGVGDATRTFDAAADSGRGADGVNDATRTFNQGDVVDPGKFRSGLDGVPIRRHKSGSKSRQAADALEEAGLDPRFARVFGAQAAERTVEHAVAAGAFEKGIAPATLLKNGSITEEGLRRGMTSMLKEYGIVDPKRQAKIMKDFFNRPTSNLPTRAAAESAAAKNAAAATAPTQRLPRTDAAATAPTQKLPRTDAAATAPTQKLPRTDAAATAPTQKLPRTDAAATAPTQKLPRTDAAATAPTQKLPRTDAAATVPTQKLPRTDAAATAPTQKLPRTDAAATAPTQKLPRTDAAATAPTQKLPRTDAAATAPTQKLPRTDAAATAPTQKLPRTDVPGTSAADASSARNAGRFSREELAARLKQADAAAPTQKLPRTDAAATAPTQKLPRTDAAATAPTQKLPRTDAAATAPTQKLPRTDAAATAPTQKLPRTDAAATAPTQKLPRTDAAATAPTQKLPRTDAAATAPTQKLPRTDAAATAPTQKLPRTDAAATAPTQKLPRTDAAATAPTQKLPRTDAAATAPTQKLPRTDAAATAPTQKLPRTDAAATAPTQKLPRTDAAATAPTQKLPRTDAAATAPTQKLPRTDAAATAPTQKLPRTDAAATAPTQKLPRTDAAATAPTQRLPRTDAAATAPTQKLPRTDAAATAPTQKLPRTDAAATAPTQKLPRTDAAATAPTQKLPRTDAAATAPTQRLPRADAAATAPTQKLPRTDAAATAPTQRLSQPAPAAQGGGAASRLDETVTLAPGAAARFAEAGSAAKQPLPFTPSALDPRQVLAKAGDDGGIVLLREGGGEIALAKENFIGAGQTTSTYGIGESKQVAKISVDGPAAHAMDNLGYKAMKGRIPVPETMAQYRLAGNSAIPGGQGVSGGLLTIAERGPARFTETADKLAAAGKGIGAERLEALQTAARRMARDGYVMIDLKADNLGFRAADQLSASKALDMVPLDNGMVVKMKPGHADAAVAMQRFLLDPGDYIRKLPREIALLEIRDRLARFDKFVDWNAMNAGLNSRKFTTLGNGAAGSVPYTPTLGLQFKGLSKGL